MPRPRKNQPIAAAPNQAYGIAGEQRQAMRSMPIPNERGTVITPPGSGAPAQPPPGAGAPGPGGAIVAAMAMRPPNPAGLAAPSGRPGEPITSGLGIGAGPGREALGGLADRQTKAMAAVLRAVGDVTGGDPALYELANKITGGEL